MKSFIAGVSIFSLFLFGSIADASQTLGTIDNQNESNYTAAFVRAPGEAGSELINFGKFTTQSQYNISISDQGIRGFA